MLKTLKPHSILVTNQVRTQVFNLPFSGFLHLLLLSAQAQKVTCNMTSVVTWLRRETRKVDAFGERSA